MCNAKIRPFPDDKELHCEAYHAMITNETRHYGILRDYAFPGSETNISWIESDRRNFRGEWQPCAEDKECILPLNHRGKHAF